MTPHAMIWLFGGFVYIGGALLFVARFPERYFPKKFDLIGSSHQLFHLAVLGGAAIHFNDSAKLYMERNQMVCPLVLPKASN